MSLAARVLETINSSPPAPMPSFVIRSAGALRAPLATGLTLSRVGPTVGGRNLRAGHAAHTSREDRLLRQSFGPAYRTTPDGSCSPPEIAGGKENPGSPGPG
jgi:hypothetical protein